ncbi:MAG: hypothetical protein HQ569_04855 [Actinobacteria bacterium]|nr:hypothetical protein [Actinomycetota bacterium]
MKSIFRKIRKHKREKNIVKHGLRFLLYLLRPFIVKCNLIFVFNLLILLISSAKYGKKRILGIYDFKTLPWSVGDPLLFIEKLSILKIIHKAGMIDICVIYDKKNPSGIRREPNINANNAQDYMVDFLPLFNTCPYLGSVFQFNSRKEFNIFLKNNIHRYDLYPSLRQHLAESYNFDGIVFMKKFEDFFNKYGYIPHLRIGERDSSWAYWFYQNYLPKDTVPVVLSLRRPLSMISRVRNADPKVWLAFIDKCKEVYKDVAFVIVGLRVEVFKGLRERSNVVIAKDYGTSIIQDLALIRSSYFYLGTVSGPSTIALFSGLPYLMFQLPKIEKYVLSEGKNFSFATENQKLFGTNVPVTPELLYSEFSKLYERLDRNKWKEEAIKNASRKKEMPSTDI